MPSRHALCAAFALPLLSLGLVASCSGNGGTGGSAGNGASASTSMGSSSGGAGGQGGGFETDGGSGAVCEPPDVLVLLDRTLTMHKTPEGNTPADAPDYQSSKWYQAITAIEKVVAPPRDQTIRFGLELWPRDPGSGQCITLAERVTDTKQATNPFCQDGEIVVPPKLGAGGEIQNYLDPATTPICISTPTGSGLITATTHLLQNAVPGRDQYVVLVTDGADWDQSCPDPNPLPIVQDLAAAGIRTFVVGFSAEGAIQPGGVGAGFLNDLACAGQTAAGFPAPCKQSGSGYVSADPAGPLLYVKAGNAGELDSALQAVTGGLCCDCIK